MSPRQAPLRWVWDGRDHIDLKIAFRPEGVLYFCISVLKVVNDDNVNFPHGVIFAHHFSIFSKVFLMVVATFLKGLQ